MKKDISCANSNAKSLWIIGSAVIALSIFFCFALFKTKDKPMPAQNTAGTTMDIGGGRQAAFGQGFCQVALPTAADMACPSFNQCFPQYSGSAQQVAFTNPNCATCPNVTQCFPQGTASAQQAALTNPNCMTCPSFNQCFPQGPATGSQQAAFKQTPCFLRCPFCNFMYNDASGAANGTSRCPRCFGNFAFNSQANNGFTKIALTQPIAAPPIFRDAVMPHEYRGVCENCHVIKPDIAIPANAQMPHEYRGVCSNCHTILGAKAGAQ